MHTFMHMYAVAAKCNSTRNNSHSKYTSHSILQDTTCRW